MSFPSWEELFEHHCSRKYTKAGSFRADVNPFYENFAQRRFNYATGDDVHSCRLVFLKDVLSAPTNKTLVRNGRFLWCANFVYEGRDDNGLRQISFTIDKGKKRFIVSENNLLCLPSKVYVNNSRFVRPAHKTFIPFSSAFRYPQVLKNMSSNMGMQVAALEDLIRSDSPYKPGSLVRPRVGYFMPDPVRFSEIKKLSKTLESHPCGIILGSRFVENDLMGQEFYRVRFGDTTYERIHPVQMEIINEV